MVWKCPGEGTSDRRSFALLRMTNLGTRDQGLVPLRRKTCLNGTTVGSIRTLKTQVSFANLGHPDLWLDLQRFGDGGDGGVVDESRGEFEGPYVNNQFSGVVEDGGGVGEGDAVGGGEFVDLEFGLGELERPG